jgi:hypothetical protein
MVLMQIIRDQNAFTIPLHKDDAFRSIIVFVFKLLNSIENMSPAISRREKCVLCTFAVTARLPSS